MLIGVDFDNTIVCYDALFHRVAVEQGLMPASVVATKGAVREYLEERGQGDVWTELQGHVYGKRMPDARAFPGALEFFSRCARSGLAICIISHKTRYPAKGPAYDLHQAARDWLEAQGFFDPKRIGLSRSDVYFELTQQAKVNRIAEVGCSHFIDDLAEVLLRVDFPATVRRILFDPHGQQHYAGRGSPDPALRWTVGLPECSEPGDLRSGPTAGSGDPRRAEELDRAASWGEIERLIRCSSPVC